MNNNKLTLILFSVLISLGVILGCSTENEIDRYLDDYEKVVEKWEEKVEKETFDMSDLNEINEVQSELLNRKESIEEEWSTDQLNRFRKLTQRLSNAMQKMSKSNFMRR